MKAVKASEECEGGEEALRRLGGRDGMKESGEGGMKEDTYSLREI